MKSGIIRRMGDLGRIAIPKEIRRVLKLKDFEPLEICVTKDGILLKKYEVEEQKMTNYIFVDNCTEEMFAVEANSKKEAKKIAHEFFPEPVYHDTATDMEVEILGIDVY